MATLERPGRQSMLWVSRLLETSGLVRCKEGFIFSPWAFKIYTGALRFGFLISMIGAVTLLMEDQEVNAKTSKACAIITGGLQLGITHILLSRKTKALHDLTLEFDKLTQEVANNEENWEWMMEADKEGIFFMKVSACILLNLPLFAVKAALMRYATGVEEYPLEMATLGLPDPLVWIYHLLSIFAILAFWLSYHSILKILVYQISVYCSVMMILLKDHTDEDVATGDWKIMKFYSDIRRLTMKLNSIFEDVFFIEIFTASLRCVLLSYQMLDVFKKHQYADSIAYVFTALSSMAFSYFICSDGQLLIDQNEKIVMGVMESNWHKYSPKYRRQLVILLTINQTPLCFNYKRFAILNIELIGNVVNTTSGFITFLYNFI